MNEIVNNFLLAGDKFMLEMHKKEQRKQKTKKEYKNLKKQEIHNIFMKTS